MTKYAFSDKDLYEALINTNTASLTIGDKTYAPSDLAEWATAKLNALTKQYAKRAEKRAEKAGTANADIAEKVLAVLGQSEVGMSTTEISVAIAGTFGTQFSVQKLTPVLISLTEADKVVRTVGKKKRVEYALAD